jgi:hypothetical protein
VHGWLHAHVVELHLVKVLLIQEPCWEDHLHLRQQANSVSVEIFSLLCMLTEPKKKKKKKKNWRLDPETSGSLIILREIWMQLN